MKANYANRTYPYAPWKEITVYCAAVKEYVNFSRCQTYLFSFNSMECRLLPNFKRHNSGRHVS